MIRFYNIPSKKINVLIVDECGSEWVVNCIPKSCQYAIVKNRGVIPYIRSFSFFMALIQNIANLGLRHKWKTLISAIIKTLEPEVVITFIDNNNLLGMLSKVYPEKKMISIQNGQRINKHTCISPNKNGYIFGDYYAFGGFTKDVYTPIGGVFSKYHSVGSLKLGLFLSKYNGKLNSKAICFVSQFMSLESINMQNPKVINVIINMYRYTVLWAINNQYKVVLSMRNQSGEVDFNDELKFFKGIIDSDVVDYSSNIRLSMDSYRKAMSSGVVIGFDSTLLTEMFGCNKKVIWGASSDHDVIKLRSFETYKYKMPKELMLDNLDQNSFNKKISNLLSIGQDEYVDLTSSARKYFMNMHKPYPHEIIKADITNFLINQ